MVFKRNSKTAMHSIRFILCVLYLYTFEHLLILIKVLTLYALKEKSTQFREPGVKVPPEKFILYFSL